MAASTPKARTRSLRGCGRNPASAGSARGVSSGWASTAGVSATGASTAAVSGTASGDETEIQASLEDTLDQLGTDLGASADPARVFKGQKMPGRMGNARTTQRGLEVFRIDAERNLLMLRGSVPGPKNGTVEVRTDG